MSPVDDKRPIGARPRLLENSGIPASASPGMGIADVTRLTK
jgi:hypothetical protein